MATDDPELAGLAQDLAPYGAGRWRLFREKGVLHAWLMPPTADPVVLRNGTRDGLRRRVSRFEQVLAAHPGDIARARAFADELDTGDPTDA